MRIVFDEIGKRFNQQWIFKKFSAEFKTNHHAAILGSNGSGKSTFLQLVSGNIFPSEGKINYFLSDEKIEVASDKVYQYVSFSGPYMDLPEELTMEEIIIFHSRFKKISKNLSTDQIIQLSDLKDSADKQVKNFSSGMKQKLKLLLSIISDTPLLLLDEPCSNLDQKSIEWYNKLIGEFSENRLIILCSNHQTHEYTFCKNLINIEEFKK